jgi:hypothetical protein
VPRPNGRCANVGCGLPIIEEEVLALHGPGRAPREIAVLTRLAGGRDRRRQPPPWRHHHPAFLVIRDATIKETIGALYKRVLVSRSLHDTDLVNRPARSKRRLGTDGSQTPRRRKKDSNLQFRSILAGEFVECYSWSERPERGQTPGFPQIADGP